MSKDRCHIYFCFKILFLCIVLMLNACIDLSGSRLQERKIKTQFSEVSKQIINQKSTGKYCGEVHTMRGGLGIFSIGMNQLKESITTTYQVPATSTMWYQSGEVSRSIAEHYWSQKIHYPIVLIGHSLGANEQIMVARYLNKVGVPVDLLVTVDSVSVTRVPPNVRHALNIYKPGFVPMFSGLKLSAMDSNATYIENVNVNRLAGMKVNHFTIDKDYRVQEMIMKTVEKVLLYANEKKGA
ncbi:MAG: hypothetical protein H0U75_06205 [Legionella sp.]|nr:hypothetical protein [Legionella sp.]